jgi:Predicted membrane protein (DUF2127)
LDAVQGGVGGPTGQGGGGILDELQKAFAAKPSTLWIVGLIMPLTLYWRDWKRLGCGGERWAEYLTFIATTLLLIPEVYELTGTITATKIIILIINLVVVVNLLFAKRLFGLRGGGRAEAAERARDSGWEALERSLPAPHRLVTLPSRSRRVGGGSAAALRLSWDDRNDAVPPRRGRAPQRRSL